MKSRLLLVLVSLMALGFTLSACQTTEEAIDGAVDTLATEVTLPTEVVVIPTEVVITEPVTMTDGLTITDGITTTDGMTGTVLAGPATLMVNTDTTLGDYVTDDQSMTLYMFTDDLDGASTCLEPTCTEDWPPFLTGSEPVAGSEELDATLLGTFTRPDGTLQVTYNGHPLYYYYEDLAAGDVKGQAMNEKWYLVSPDGEMVSDVQ